MKFGKQIQADQVPGWSQYYLDYKALKKIISALNSRLSSSAAVLNVGQPEILSGAGAPERDDTFDTPMAVSDDLPTLALLGQDDERGADFQVRKAAFFFKLERELEKINAFYLEKEAELRLRLETLLSKRRAAAMRVLPDSLDDISTKTHVEWNAVEEGFRLLERDLGKIQQFVDVNATGFRKILKKWDKRSKSSTKELYLARQVDVQPVFNRQLISELSDTVAACLLDLTDLTVGLKYEGPVPEDLILTRQLNIDGWNQAGRFHDLESNFRKAVAGRDSDALRELVRFADSLSQSPDARMHITRILWKTIIDAPPDLADLILASTTGPFDYLFIDDINGRTCLHEASIVGALRLVNLCLDHGVQRDKVDIYGRSPLHYAAMNGHAAVCRRLIEVGLPPDLLDLDNCTPLIYATLKGSVDCIRVLLEEGNVSAQTSVLNGDLMPLSLAARSGHLDVVVLLLAHGAPSLPNTNGEYPIHLAAQEGHAEVCKLLTRHEGWDTADKYNDWTPLFHAARYGHEDCLRVLLEFGCRTDLVDEMGYCAIYYAAWYGHFDCVSLLMGAAARQAARSIPSSSMSPGSETSKSLGLEFDIDAIPSLSLPPPMMPYRVYGHNYLDKNSMVQISVGHSSSRFGDTSAEPSRAIRLLPPLSNSVYTDRHLHTSPRVKLVMTATPVITTAPYSIPLPLSNDRTVFTFQVPSVESLSLEFSLYPNFGTKTIGRAIALPTLFSRITNSQAFTIPILDHRLHIIGEVSFEVNIINPFSGVTLEIGGAVETYWKSLASPVSNPSLKPVLQRPNSTARSFGLSSAQTSPSNHSIIAGSGHSLTHSSLAGNFIYITVQVTRDLYPVVYPEWRLPETGYDLGVADVTLSQFLELAKRLDRSFAPLATPISLPDLRSMVARSMVSLAELLKIIPPTLGVCVEVAYPSSIIRQRHSLRHQLDLNDVVNAVLRTVYNTTLAEGAAGRRSVVFTSFSPDVCSALNWKQPNYPVFFASQCGRRSLHLPSSTGFSVEDAQDYRLSNLASAVDFCKMNNFLGLFVEAGLLQQIPSLIQGVRDCGLLVGAFGGLEHASLFSGADSNGVDAFLQDGILTFDQSKRT